MDQPGEKIEFSSLMHEIKVLPLNYPDFSFRLRKWARLKDSFIILQINKAYASATPEN